jgi:hypothetical protein
MKVSFDPTTALIMLLAGIVATTVRQWSTFIRRWYNKILNWLIWRAGRVVQQSFASRVSLKRYCELQLDAADSKHLELPSAFSKLLETDEMFVPLLLDEGRGGEQTFSHASVLEAGSRVRVVGDPGSGKSSLIKRVYRDACREALRSPRQARLPIRIELKDFIAPEDDLSPDDLAEWAITQLRANVIHAVAFDIADAFDSYCNNGGLLVLLDGLDEVPGAAYPRTAAAIRALSKRLELMSQRNVMILTMRQQFHNQVAGDFTSTFPRALHIRRLTPNDIFKFLTQWPFDDVSAGPQHVNRIYAELTDRPTLRTMCTNPLVLAMYVATDERTAHTAELPETRSSFYRQVVTELLVARRARQVGAAPAGVARRRERETILGRMALRHLLDADQSPNAIPWTDAVTVTCEVLKLDDHDAAEAYLRNLATETGLFSEERERESLRFIHLTFCEFFAANEATDGSVNGWEQLVNAHRSFSASAARQLNSRLTEVVPFAVGLLRRGDLDTALDDVRMLEDPEILLRCFLETQKYDHPSWQPFAREQIAKLAATPADGWDKSWLGRLALLSVVVREAERWTRALATAPSPFTLEQIFGQLVGDDQERLVRVFAAFASEDPAASLRLAETSGVDLVAARPDLLVEGCVDPPFLSLAIERAKAEGDRPRAWPSIFAEAALRYEVVAKALAERPAPTAWAARAEAVERESRWGGNSMRPGKLHAVSLTIGCSEERLGPATSCFPLLKALTFVPAPATLVSDRTLRLLTVLCILVSGLMGLLAVGVSASGGTAGVTPNYAFLALSFAAYTGGFSLMIYVRNRRDIYAKLTNLPRRPVISRAPLLLDPFRLIGEEANRLPPRRPKRFVALSDDLRAGIGTSSVELLYFLFIQHGDELLIVRSDDKYSARLGAMVI